MDIVSPHLDIISIHSINHGQVTFLSMAGSSSASPSQQRRLQVHLGAASPKSRVVIAFCDAPSCAITEVEFRLKGTRQARKRSWELLRVINQNQGNARCRAYRIWSEGHSTVLLLRIPETASFLSSIPDNTPLGDITLPGTHESCALYGFPISQCQQPSTPILQQLEDGIRYLDVRLRVVGEEILMYHGPQSQRSSLPVLLQAISSFLDSHPSETLLVCLKEESPPNHPQFARKVFEAFQPFLSGWFLQNRIPSLGEVRGRAILLTRFDRGDDEKIWGAGMGIHPYTWPDSRKEGFEWNCSGTRFRIQDWYRVTTFLNIPEKFEAIVNHLIPTLESTPDHPFTLSCTSASYFPLSLPTIIAKGFGWPQWGLGVYGINSRFCGWALRQIADGKRIRGCIPMDFYRQCGDEKGLAEVLVSMNFLDPE